jgi:EAL domain-containing protein (putative c-di-GMP-specific phosphodiesterase class I)
VHALKIDRSFVASMTKDAQHRAIVHSILSLAGSLELKVVAEGVETPEQADMLRSLSCDELQGYLFSRPLPPDEFVKWALRNA